MHTRLPFKGRVVLITGGGRGLGRAFAGAFASRGAAVSLLARSGDELEETAGLIRKAGGAAVCFAADVSDPSAVQEAVRQTAERLGPIDVLVNNAGAAGPIGTSWEVDGSEWWRCLEVNLRGAVLCSRAVLPSMAERGAGRIIHVASGSGTRSTPYMSAYVVSKTALIRFSEILAAEAAPCGVSVFAIGPGPVPTRMFSQVLASPEARRWMPWLNELSSRTVSEQPSTALVLALASGKADALSGRFLTISDDLERLVRRADSLDDDDRRLRMHAR